MAIKADVDLLRKTLVVNGLILPVTPDQLKGPKTFQHGEWLVSLLSTDDQLNDFLTRTCADPAFRRRMRGFLHGGRRVGYRFTPEGNRFSSLWSSKGKCSDFCGRSFLIYVETIKFMWLLHGTVHTLSFIKRFGLYEWSLRDAVDRDAYLDDLITISERKLRNIGVKYSEMAEFFADSEAVASLHDVFASDLH